MVCKQSSFAQGAAPAAAQDVQQTPNEGFRTPQQGGATLRATRVRSASPKVGRATGSKASGWRSNTLHTPHIIGAKNRTTAPQSSPEQKQKRTQIGFGALGRWYNFLVPISIRGECGSLYFWVVEPSKSCEMMKGAKSTRALVDLFPRRQCTLVPEAAQASDASVY
eukprot:6107081-Amphidinium_carterae.1